MLPQIEETTCDESGDVYVVVVVVVTVIVYVYVYVYGSITSSLGITDSS